MNRTPKYLEDIKTIDLWNSLRPILLNYLQQFTKYPETEGIAVLGGAADTKGRKFLDKFSDLDASLFISLPIPPDMRGLEIRDFLDVYQSKLPPWLPPFEIYINHPDYPEKIEINIHQQIIELEDIPNRKWNEMRKEAYTETCEIIYDRSGRLSKLIQEKTAWDDIEAKRTLLRVLGQAYWHGIINPMRQVQRGFLYNAHDLLNEALELMIHAVYLVNCKYRPHKKWRLQVAFHLANLPHNFQSRVLEALIVSGMTEKMIRTRVEVIQSLLEDVNIIASRIYNIPTDLAECYQMSCLHSFDDRQLRNQL